MKVNLHYYQTSLDYTYNKKIANKELLLSEIAKAIKELLTEDCDLKVEHEEDYLPIHIHVSLGKPGSSPEPILVFSEGDQDGSNR